MTDKELMPNKGQFPPGQSGNKLGRPKGSKNKSTVLREAMQSRADRLLSAHVPKVLRVVIEAAIRGDMSAAKMILDRAVPVHKATEGDSTGNNIVKITIQNLTSPHEEDHSGITINGESHEQA